FTGAMFVPLIATVLPAFGAKASLVPGARQTVTGRAARPAAAITAVLLAAIVSATDEEPSGAPAALQGVEGNPVHSRRRVDGNWTGASGSARLRAYGPFAARTVRVRVAARARTPSPSSVGLTPSAAAGRVSETLCSDVSATTRAAAARA